MLPLKELKYLPLTYVKQNQFSLLLQFRVNCLPQEIIMTFWHVNFRRKGNFTARSLVTNEIMLVYSRKSSKSHSRPKNVVSKNNQPTQMIIAMREREQVCSYGFMYGASKSVISNAYTRTHKFIIWWVLCEKAI